MIDVLFKMTYITYVTKNIHNLKIEKKNHMFTYITIYIKVLIRRYIFIYNIDFSYYVNAW